MCGLTLANASCNNGWTLLGVETAIVGSKAVDFFCWFGDDDTVVAEVFAVRGRSAEAWATAAPEVAGIFPPISNRFILDFSSSSSSHMEVAGPVLP